MSQETSSLVVSMSESAKPDEPSVNNNEIKVSNESSRVYLESDVVQDNLELPVHFTYDHEL